MTKEPEISIGYIKSFTFNDLKSKEMLSGHPEEGRVYELINADGLYNIYIGSANNQGGLDGIFLGEDLNGTFQDKWTFEVQIINKDNLFDNPLTADDLEKVTQWLDTNHEELRGKLSKAFVPVMITERGMEKQRPLPPLSQEAIREVEKSISETLAKHLPIPKDLIEALSNNLNFLVDHDPELLEVVSDVLSKLVEDIKAPSENPIRDQLPVEFLLFSESPDVAVYNSLEALRDYAADHGKNKNSLFRAIRFLLLELQRRNLHNDQD